jgi:sigma-B regulation protein RsbU (phosphoserine phosphatase)
VNGGHDVPLVKQGGGGFGWLKTRPGLMPGFMSGTRYEQDQITMQKGDTLLLYTDGVTEAENPEKEQFTKERLYMLANENKNHSTKDMLLYLREKIQNFANGAEQSDDITMLALTVKR